MTRDTYIRMTSTTRTLLSRLPGGLKLLRLPTLIYAAIYPLTLIWLMLMRDPRIVRVLLVPAACFLLVTLIRPIINRQRPYDFFNAAPVGSYRSGKGKSMPSRHTASAAAIAIVSSFWDAIKDIEQDYKLTLEQCHKLTLEDCNKYNPVFKLIGKLLWIISPLM